MKQCLKTTKAARRNRAALRVDLSRLGAQTFVDH